MIEQDGTGWNGIIEQDGAEWDRVGRNGKELLNRNGAEWDEIGIYRWPDNLGHDDAILTVLGSQQFQNPLLLEAYYLFIKHYVYVLLMGVRMYTVYTYTYMRTSYTHTTSYY